MCRPSRLSAVSVMVQRSCRASISFMLIMSSASYTAITPSPWKAAMNLLPSCEYCPM